MLAEFVVHMCKTCGTFYQTLNEEDSQCLDCQFPPIDKSKPQEIIIRPELIDTSKLVTDIQSNLWRPSNFDSYIGQESLKIILQSYIRGCKELNKPFPHFLVDGKAGMGKTTIAYILANKLGLNFVESLANTIKSPQQLIDLLVEVNGGILLIDEMQIISKQVATVLLPIMEDFKINGKHIHPFTLFGCTTEKGILIKKWKPLVDRFKIQKTLDRYSIEELVVLLKQYKANSFQNVQIENEVYYSIAKNSRGTPRIGIRLLESFIYMQKPLEDVYKAYNIVYNGITTEDVRVLKLLSENPKGVGLNSICAFLQTSVENFLYQQESYLIELGLITIGSRRIITQKGIAFLTKITNPQGEENESTKKM